MGITDGDPGQEGAGAPAVRVGDEERSKALDRLRDHCADGRLTLDEFADRATVVLGAGSRSELDRVLEDLPDRTQPPRLQRGLRLSVAIFGSNRKRVRWRLARRARALAIGGTCWLDLREASIDADEVLITATAIFGTVKVVVPQGIGVELTGLPFFGAKTDTTTEGRLPTGPVVRVRGFPVFGTVRVINVNPPSPADLQLREDFRRKVLGLPPAS